jgi:hypothetical protein
MSASKVSPNELQQQVAELQRQMALLMNKMDATRAAPAQPAFTEDDRQFLVWTLGFVAGSHLDRDGDRGERIFAWCRELQGKLQQKHRPLTATEINAS